MNDSLSTEFSALKRRLAESEATVRALLSGEIDAVVDPRSNSPVLLAQAQQALRASEERYRGIVETADEGIWTLNFDSTITFVNSRLAGLLGYAVSEMIGQSAFKFLPPAIHNAAARRIARSADGLGNETESVILQRSGQELAVLVRTSPVRDANGVAIGLLAMITDKSAHREAQRVLRARDSEYRQIVESTTDGIIKVDRSGVISFVNGRLAEMVGYTPSQLVGASLRTLVPPSEWDSVIHALQGDDPGASTNVDMIYRHRSGAEVAVNIAGSALRDEKGNWIGAMGFVRDVTERKKLQAQLIVSDRMATVGTLAAGVAHEINNPLAAIIANLEFVAEGVMHLSAQASLRPNEEWIRDRISEPLADAQEAADRVRFIVRDLMIFSRSPVNEPRMTVDVNAALESALRMGANEIRHRARLIKSLGDVPPVAGNEARLGQVFLNLIVNAAQSMPIGQVGHNEIRATTYQAEDMVVIEIADTGVGMAPDVLERIFDAFYTTKDVGAGTGLGLAICQRIVADMHGTLTVTSTPGAGSTFRVSVPIARESFVPGQTPTETRIPRRGARMLVVDDEELVARIVERSLGDAYEILAATNAWAALALVEAGHRFDVILCDLMMPTMTGMELHKALSTEFPDQARRMLFMTGGTFTLESRQFVTNIGCQHIEKPFDLETLRSCVHDFLVAADSSS